MKYIRFDVFYDKEKIVLRGSNVFNPLCYIDCFVYLNYNYVEREGAQMDQNKFNRQMKELVDRVNYADAALESYFEMKYGSTNWNEVYHLGGAFWNITIKSLMENSLIHIAGVYKRLIWLLENQAALKDKINSSPPEYLIALGKYKQDFDSYETQFKNLMKIRNKALAHFDKEYLDKLDELFKKHSLSIEDLRKMVILERDACNALAGKHLAARYINYNDVSRVLCFCYRHLENEKGV